MLIFDSRYISLPRPHIQTGIWGISEFRNNAPFKNVEVLLVSVGDGRVTMKSIVGRVLQQFLKNTTLHGFKYITSPYYIDRWVFFVFLWLQQDILNLKNTFIKTLFSNMVLYYLKIMSIKKYYSYIVDKKHYLFNRAYLLYSKNIFRFLNVLFF